MLISGLEYGFVYPFLKLTCFVLCFLYFFKVLLLTDSTAVVIKYFDYFSVILQLT